MNWKQQETEEMRLGAIADLNGCHFSIFKSTEHPLELVLFDDNNQQYAYPLSIIGLHQFGTYIHGVIEGTRYSYRGKCDKNKTKEEKLWILDPYAKQLCQHPETSEIPCAIVTNNKFNWDKVLTPKIPTTETIIYELHVKGFTQLNKLIPPDLRGKFLGLCHPNCIQHFIQIGITSLQLMPIMASIDEIHLAQKKLTNYWGYNPIAWFAPDPKFGVIDPLIEFKTMVKTLHQHGIEVILDVVFNHTSESGEIGFIHHFKYLSPEVYLSHQTSKGKQYQNYTGCGNTMDLRHRYSLRIVMDCLRYWIQECHVDGFRFDLAATLGRNANKFKQDAAFFQIIQQDPIISKSKLIAEPWDIGEDGYQLGNFPLDWHECNDKFRDTCRDFWNHNAAIGELATQIMGFRDIFSAKHWPYKFSVNYVSYHDGFTLEDLVCYNKKHNQANGEANKDGHNHNCSFNHGVEGPTNNNDIQLARQQQKRNLITTLLFSFGIPHLLAADTFNHSQQGNNNAYCQDNDISWINWLKQDVNFSDWLQKIIQLRQKYMVPMINAFLGEQRYKHKIAWLEANGKPVNHNNWSKQSPLQLYIALNQQKPALLYLFNRTANQINFELPTVTPWLKMCDSSENEINPSTITQIYQLKPRSLAIFSQH